MGTAPGEVVLTDQILSGVFPPISAELRRYMHYTSSLISILTATLLLAISGCGLEQGQPADTIEKPVTIPTQYRAHRFLATPVTSQGDTLNFITDSGGNSAFIFQHEARRLDLTGVDYRASGMYSGISEEFDEVEMPRFQENTAIPQPSRQGGILFSVPQHWLYEEVGKEYVQDLYGDADGLLGNSWFAGRTWRFDYARRKLVWKADGNLPETAQEHRVELTPLHGEPEAPENGMMTLPVIVDDDTLTTLFDTGATVVLTDSALKAIGGGSPVRSSFHVDSRVFDRWRREHPEWRFIENAHKAGKHGQFDLIEAPKIKVGGHEVGPVWFNENKLGDDFQAAIGGAALKYFDAVTVDFKEGIAVFER